ncbi:type VI secretion system amidase effector protein Tae4 [Marinomonas fungiae]|uniref:type VI secretion system amidase effector protein Tae4 n=1 Tax=Marinomonas fungiae TaxID=1137284 RepID=UPI003A913283
MKTRCQNKQANSSRPFGNYCAINLSDALIKSGVSTASAKVKKCWGYEGMKHILLAEEMADWLNQSGMSWLGKVEKINPSTFQDDLDGRTGVIFFKDYWTRGNESFSNRSGDHIDLWNKDEITSSSMLVRGIIEFFGRVSDLNESKEIWFWEVK